MSSRITVYYRFHALAGKELEVISASRRSDLPITVRGRDGIDLKIRRWMPEPAARSIEVSQVAALPLEVLRAVADRLAMPGLLRPATAGTDPSPQTQPSRKEDNRGAGSYNVLVDA